MSLSSTCPIATGPIATYRTRTSTVLVLVLVRFCSTTRRGRHSAYVSCIFSCCDIAMTCGSVVFASVSYARDPGSNPLDVKCASLFFPRSPADGLRAGLPSRHAVGDWRCYRWGSGLSYRWIFGRERYGPQYGPPSVSQSISRPVSIPGGRIQPNRAGSGGMEIIYLGGNMVPGTRIVPPCGPMRALEIRNFINKAS